MNRTLFWLARFFFAVIFFMSVDNICSGQPLTGNAGACSTFEGQKSFPSRVERSHDYYPKSGLIPIMRVGRSMSSLIPSMRTGRSYNGLVPMMRIGRFVPIMRTGRSNLRKTLEQKLLEELDDDIILNDYRDEPNSFKEMLQSRYLNLEPPTSERGNIDAGSSIDSLQRA